MFYTQTSEVMPIGTDDCVKFNGIAFDGTNFYLTIPRRRAIDIFNNSFHQIRRVDTCHAYSAISYDEVEHCFWATAYNENSRIYKLNHCLQEIDYIYVNTVNQYCEVLTGVSARESTNTLLVSFSNSILEIDKNGNVITELLRISEGNIDCVLALGEEYVYSYTNNLVQTIFVYTYAGTQRLQFALPGGFFAEDMALYSQTETIDLTRIIILSTRKCAYSYVVVENFLDNDFVNSVTEFVQPADGNGEYVKKANHEIEYLIKLEEYIGRILLAESNKIKNMTSDEKDWQELCRLIDNFSKLEEVLDKKIKLIKDIEIQK